ncbi:MAG: (E)-4-hydroxy-3-methylbut-2-enyl-diphosphate synthase [Bacteroidales bacterium]
MTSSKFCESLTYPKRLKTPVVYVGDIPMGGSYPVRIQSMTNTDTKDAEATARQILKIAKAGADYARMTTTTIREAQNIENIRKILQDNDCHIPLIADVHFNPKIAETAAKTADKVRINPGNYAYNRSQKGDLPNIENNFRDLINICKDYGTALRIGVNHGSLSQRILDAYGDTPEGMVVSAMEFLHICREENFHQIVVSLKSSNTQVMVKANRLMVNTMLKHNMLYPLHLGVTEAGEGEDGRIKSAVGIASLLNDGIGDTIRVSLTEAPELEIPYAKKLRKYSKSKAEEESIPPIDESPINHFILAVQKEDNLIPQINTAYPVVFHWETQRVQKKYTQVENIKADFILKTEKRDNEKILGKVPVIVNEPVWRNSSENNVYPYFYSISSFSKSKKKSPHLNFVFAELDELNDIHLLKEKKNVVLILQSFTANPPAEQRRFIFELIRKKISVPIIIQLSYSEKYLEDLQLKAASDAGSLFLDGLVQGILIENKGELSPEEVISTAFGILQATRVRISKTEFISCPGCGRTLFDLEATAKKIKRRLSYFKGLKIAVMGCIVNGPGEMADADYGYIGSGNGKVTLYKRDKLVKKNIPEEDAIDELERLIARDKKGRKEI